MKLTSIDDVRAAARRLRGVATRTPLLRWADEELWLKPESLQPIGAFKLRGAYNAVAALPDAERRSGVVGHSSGNHGQALAYAARAFQVPCVIVSPDVAAPVKVDAMRRLGAEVILVSGGDRKATTLKIAADRGMTMVPPFDHPEIIAGQGTIALEVAEDLPDVDVVLVPVGGGGLAAGVAAAIKAIRPGATVIGVEPELAADAKESLAAGRVVDWGELGNRTMADGLRTSLSELTLAHLAEYVDDIVTVTEDEIRAATAELIRRARLVVEPSGAVATAAYLNGRTSPGRTVSVVSGGNVDPAVLADLLAGGA